MTDNLPKRLGRPRIADTRLTPMSPADIQETIAGIKDAQEETALLLATWLRKPSAAALERLSEGRAREDELFRIVLKVDPFPGWSRRKPPKDEAELDRNW